MRILSPEPASLSDCPALVPFERDFFRTPGVLCVERGRFLLDPGVSPPAFDSFPFAVFLGFFERVLPEPHPDSLLFLALRRLLRLP